mmetsp:Transcript_17934/g.53358  ORF Transcript_17934/g.53358 Transcript_17934/m.53358 type:complete len:429 (+) Transcript_17934:50-1336(+)
MRCLVVAAVACALAPQHDKPYRVVFRGRHKQFRAADFAAALAPLGRADHAASDVARVYLSDDCAARTLAARSIHVRYVLEEWGCGRSLEAATVEAPPTSPLFSRNASWRLVESRPVGGKALLKTARDPAIFKALKPCLDALPGPVDLNRAEEDICVVFAAEETVVGRVVAEGRAQKLLEDYKVADRRYRGSTTMDAALSFTMARAAGVEAGHVVLDPFAGTGGCLLAACHFSGTRGYAADSDARVLLRGTKHEVDGRLRLSDRLRAAIAEQLAAVGVRREKRRGESTLAEDASVPGNFADRGLPAPRLVVSDVSVLDERLEAEEFYFDDLGAVDRGRMFDAIVTDPPYGIRERVDETGASDVVMALFALAERRLRPGGRLAFWHPSTARRAPGLPETLPFPPSLAFVSAATQSLRGERARTLIVLERR